MNQHFTRGQARYICRRCKQATRDTGTGEGQHDLCAACYEIESYENEHSDDQHRGTIHDCKKCRKLLSDKAKAKLDEENAAIKKAMPTTKLSRKAKAIIKHWDKIVAERHAPPKNDRELLQACLDAFNQIPNTEVINAREPVNSTYKLAALIEARLKQ